MKKIPKSHWNYRVMVVFNPPEFGIFDPYFQIHEVYYTIGKPNGYTETPIRVSGNSLKDIKWQLDMIKLALKKPILYQGERFPEEYKPK